MEHIRQFDWCYSQPDICFIRENDLAHSVTQKILQNEFHDPLSSSDSEEETPKIDWDQVFSKRNLNSSRNLRIFVPCMPKFIEYPKLSSLTQHQHFQCLKVLCAYNPHILPKEFIPKPTQNDFKTFEDLKATYEKEQIEFKEWAKTQWTNKHCIKALRPKPIVEQVYESRFKMIANELESYPKMYNMAAQIPLEASNNSFNMVSTTDLKSVDIKVLPQIELDLESPKKKMVIMQQCRVPKPCNKHPCRFILPNEKAVSILPLTEVKRELAQYALDNDATHIASENAVKALLETDRGWDITLSVVCVIGPDGGTTNVVVMGNEFSVNKEPALMRTYRAFKHLLQHSLIPKSELSKLCYTDPDSTMNTDAITNNTNIFDRIESDNSSDEEEYIGLCIDEGEIEEELKFRELKRKTAETQQNKSNNTSSNGDDAGLYKCTCKDTIFERPPPRSFKKLQVRDKNTKENYDIIVHYPNKVRDNSGEVILEPIPEYQLDLGASAQSRNKIRSLALSLLLRKNASLVNVRIDGVTGEVATFEKLTNEEFKAKHGDYTDDICNVLHTTFSQLEGLLPGTYILRHEPNHGNNAILYAAKNSISSMLELKFDSTQLAEADEASIQRTAPVIIPLLLPYHKFRRILPCAFTPYEKYLMREQKRAPKGNKTPPRALQWPKKKKKKNKKNYYKQ